MPPKSLNTLDHRTPFPLLISRINENFRMLPKGVSDMGLRQMPVVSFSTGSLAAGAAYTATFGVGDIDGTFPGNAGLITPRVDMYIDTDANAAYLWPNGVTLTSSSKRALCFIQVARTPSANQKITLQAYVENRDTVAHTYYCTVDAIYLTGMK